MTFTVRVTNGGSEAATNITIADTVPTGYSYAGTMTGGDAQNDSGDPDLTWTINSLASSSFVDLTFTATVLAPTGAVGEYMNVAEVSASGTFDPDSVPGNDDGDQSEDDEDNASIGPQVADLSLVKTVSDATPNVGDSVTFTITVSNAGPDAATNVAVSDVLPGGFSYDAGSIAGGDGRDDSGAPTLVWTITSIPSGAAAVLTLLIWVLLPAPIG